MKRWKTTIYYRTDHGMAEVSKECMEISEVAEFVEEGPHWWTIDKIVTTYQWSDRQITIEEAEKL